MNIYESKRQLDYANLMKKTIKRKKKAIQKKSKKLLPSKRMLQKKTGKWCIKRDKKINKVLDDNDAANFLYNQLRAECDQLSSDFKKEIIKIAGIPEQNFDCITLKTSRHHSRICLYCEKFNDSDGYDCDQYVIDLDTNYVYALREGKTEEDAQYLLSYFILTPTDSDDEGIEDPAY